MGIIGDVDGRVTGVHEIEEYLTNRGILINPAREREVGWRVIQRLLKQDWRHVVWDHTR